MTSVFWACRSSSICSFQTLDREDVGPLEFVKDNYLTSVESQIYSGTAPDPFVG